MKQCVGILRLYFTEDTAAVNSESSPKPASEISSGSTFDWALYHQLRHTFSNKVQEQQQLEVDGDCMAILPL